MNRTTTFRRTIAAGAAVALTAGGLLIAVPAVAAPSSDNADPAAQCAGRGIPANKISIQMFSIQGWIQTAGLDAVLEDLRGMGYRNIEPFGTPGSAFSTYGDLTAPQFRTVTDEHALKVPTSHGSTAEPTFQTSIADAKALGHRYIGSGQMPAPGIATDGSSTYEDVLATAETMNRLGEQSVKAGTGKLFGHNHEWEFSTIVTDPETGEQKPAWEVVVENTDPRWVTFQLDTLLAIHGGADVVDLLERYGDRIELLHVKDGFPGGADRPVQTDVGEGALDWAPILDAAQGHVKYYIVERAGGDAEFAEDSFEFLHCTEF
jgi:sugar phosphate isomerase/epimerase